MKKTYYSHLPDLNVKRRNESVATYNVYCDTFAIDDGSKCSQEFVGTKTLASNVYVMKSVKQLVNILEDNIR